VSRAPDAAAEPERAQGSVAAGLRARAERLMPGGVSSPVRAFRSVGSESLFVRSASGARLTDVDGNEYIDFVMSWGALLLGHAHTAIVEAVRDAAGRGTSYGACSPLEVEAAELVTWLVPSVEMVRFVNSGTEATMAAVRLARAATGREGVLKFTGCYHGHADPFLVRAGSGVATLGLPDSPGVPSAIARQTRVAPYNDLDAVAATLREAGDEIACLIVEPVVGNGGFIPPADGFLPGLRDLCDRHGALLIFDEVMTGFRVAPGGAQERWEVRPDLTTLGKVIGGGLPVGAYGGPRELMERIAPAGPVYQAGTLSGNPVAMAAGIAQLEAMRDGRPHAALEARGTRLATALGERARELGQPFWGSAAGAMFGFHLLEGPVRDFETASTTDRELFGRLHRAAMRRGVLLPPSPFEAAFLSMAHGDDVIDDAADRLRDALTEAVS